MLVGVFMILKYFVLAPAVPQRPVPGDYIKAVADELEQWGVVTLAFAIILGVLNMARINLKAVTERKTDWGYKLVLLACMVTMMTFGVFKWVYDEQTRGADKKAVAAEQAAAPASEVTALKVAAESARRRADSSMFQFTFEFVYTPLAATIYALLAFYVASAAFRSFRAKNWLATLLLVSAVIVMVGRVPIGGMLWRGFPWLQEWLMTWPNTAGQRAIQMGAAVGVIASGLRVIFGIERPYLKG